MHGLELIARLLGQAERPAIACDGAVWSYGDLLDRSASCAAALLDGRHDLHGARVLLLAPPGVDAVAALLAIWRAGGVAVPLAPLHPPPEWLHIATDSRASFALVAAPLATAFAPVGLAAHVRTLPADARSRAAVRLPDPDPDRDALLLYTSGTTGRPKGVTLTHRQVQAQVESLVNAWGWTADDRVLHVLPMNHTHGLINALVCPLWAGALCELAAGFDVEHVWERLASGDVTVFMGVPTMYQRLLGGWDLATPATKRRWCDGARQLRLMVSGSAPLPVATFERWRLMAGQALLERYGMTETGMILSNPLRGERRPGLVGTPLPGVEVRVVGDDGHDVAPGTAGELLVRGPGVFRGYWDDPEATGNAFTSDGWFRTGDVGAWTEGAVRLLGRRSVDIIKTGGEKVSALEIEDILREHPGTADCAIVGLPDAEWGQCVCAVVVPRAEAVLDLEQLREWARPRLAPSKLPRRLVVMADLPRNALGKVNKGALLAELAGGQRSRGASQQ